MSRRGEAQVFGSLFDQFPVASVPGGPGMVPCSGDLVVDHFSDLVRLGFPGSSRRGGLPVSAVHLVTWLDVLLSDPVLLVVLSLGLSFHFFVSFPSVLVMFCLQLGRDSRKLGRDLAVEH